MSMFVYATKWKKKNDKYQKFGDYNPARSSAMIKRRLTNAYMYTVSQKTTLTKLAKSVDVDWSYSVQRQCRFLRHSVYTIYSC